LLLISIQELSKISQDQIDVFCGVASFASSSKQKCFLKENKECFILVHSLLSDLEQGSLFPKVSNKV